MNSDEWNVYIKEECLEKIQGEYIICYFLGEANKYMNYVKELSKKMGVPYYVIPVTVKQKNDKNCVPFPVGPCEFVSLIKNSKYVVTDSFHGTAFAVNYNIPFTVFKRFKDNDPKNQNSRIYSFLDMLGLENRLVDYKKSVGDVLECDFSNANKKLSERREESLNYLKNALKSAVNEPKNPENVPFKITDLCCGCGACASVCKKGAISIILNEEGFNHYSIDAEKCVNCGQCKSVCPMTQIKAPEMKSSVALYSVKSNSEEVLKKSASGGIGHELASQLLNSGYAVCGCVYETETNSAKHIWVTPDEKEKLSLFQGSKYIQSNTADAISEIENIAEKYKIAFFGTPCQAVAIDKILSKKGVRKDAVIVDLICHGVPSYHLWNKYICDVNKKCGTGENPVVSFRGEGSDWHNRMLQVTGNGNTHKQIERIDDFYAFFRRGLCDMATCFDCPYRERSGADLRIGDYWGNKFINDKQGVSMVIANTDAGNKLICDLKNVCNVEEQNLDEYWSVQCPYNLHKPLIREELIEALNDETTDLHELRKKYCSYYDWFEKLTDVVKLATKFLKRG
jgi:coenzyme F420-reducing hydrogenase beta subunit